MTNENNKDRFYLGICLIASIVITLITARGMSDSMIIPFGDSGGFYNYALELYGHVHSGQWSEAGQVLMKSSKNLFPSVTLFLLLPESMANSAGYGFVNNLSWHLFLMAGIWIFMKALKRERLALPVFILVSANNYAWDPAYYYYMDFPFMGLAIFALALSVKALKQPETKTVILAGSAAALCYFSKPPNALIHTALTAAMVGGVFLTRVIQTKEKMEWNNFGRFIGLWAAGFLPVFAVAALFGGLASIVDVIYLNEIGKVFYSELSEGGLKRVLYFPFCLTFYYSQLLLAGLLIILSAFRFVPKLQQFSTRSNENEAEAADLPILIWVFVMFILFWGFYFSFLLDNKLIRSLTPMLPILWILLFSATPLHTLRRRILLPLCTVFFILVFSQAEHGFIKDKQSRNPETYHINGDWLNRWPAKRANLAAGTATTDHLKKALVQAGVEGGQVGVGTEMMSWNAHALNNWCNQDSIRQGRPPAYDFKYICPGRFTKPLKNTMDGADALLLILEPRVQYNQNLYKINVDLTNYAFKNWQNKHAKVALMKNGAGQPSICIVAFHNPLQGELLDKLRTDLYPDGFAGESKGKPAFAELSLKQKIAVILSGNEDGK